MTSRYDPRDNFHQRGSPAEQALKDWLLNEHGFKVVKRTRPENRFDPIDSYLVGSDLLIEHRIVSVPRWKFLEGTKSPLWLGTGKTPLARSLGVPCIAIWHGEFEPFEPVRWWADIRKPPPGSVLAHPADLREPDVLDDRDTYPWKLVSIGWEGVFETFDNALAQGNLRYDYNAHYNDDFSRA